MFSRSTQQWFDETFKEATEVQRRGWPVIGTGAHSLLVAPTGSGKTLAAFLAGLDSCLQLDPAAVPGVRVLYISPLKALVYDVERNLRAPLAGITRTAERLALPRRNVRVSVRTGDTPQRDRQRFLREPGEILVTTPESLFLLLGSQARETLRTVHTVIVDEVHALAPTKRGCHLALSLERLAVLTARDPQRLGLSATARPIDEIARFLGGSRPVEIVDAGAPPKIDLTVTIPPQLENSLPVEAPSRAADSRSLEKPMTGGSILRELAARESSVNADEGVRAPDGSSAHNYSGHSAQGPSPGVWSAIYPQLVELIRAHRSTIVFVNSRGLCERLAQRLNDLAEEPLVLAHHGSVSLEKRAEIEEGLKAGELKAIVATSSLELGIDMGAVDLVVLVESPGSVARGLQRIGRAGHQVGEVSRGKIFPKFRGDLLECAVVSARMREGAIEGISVPQNALDVLAQQIVALCTERPQRVGEVETLVRRAYPFHQLPSSLLEAVLDMLSGRYASSEFADLRPLLSWDRSQDELSPRRSAALVSRMNAGTIPDRGTYGVFLGADGPRVGELDEEMVFETRPGENIMLGASTWRVEEITRDRVVVTPAPGEPGRLPFWRGDGPGRPIELGRAIGQFVRELAAQPQDGASAWVAEQSPLDEFAAQNLVSYVFEQKEHSGGVLPTDRCVVIERFRDELGDWRVCILTPFGARIHAPWAMALQRLLSRDAKFEVQVMYTDDGIVLRFADADVLPDAELLLPDAEDVEELLTDQLADTALFAALFRENAARSLLLPRRRPGKRNPLWAQRLKSQALLATVRKFSGFPIVLETYRQALRDQFDLGALQDLLRDIRSRKLQVREVETASASPFARSLVFAYVAAYIYDQDAPLAERRAQALTLDRNLLSELLGQAELRELIDPEVLAELESELQYLATSRQARDPDELHDVLRRLGDLTEAEIEARVASDDEGATSRAASKWIEQLQGQRRAIRVQIASEPRWIAAELTGLYRDALGAMPPAGLPASFLEFVPDALEELIRRFARQHGPFSLRHLAERYGLARSSVEAGARKLELAGELVHGEIRPGGTELDWCDAELLRRLKRRTLARLRNEVAPVDAATLGAFLPQWHSVESTPARSRALPPGGGHERLLEAITLLEGLALPWSELSQTILPQRVPNFHLDQLDRLAASGAIVWVGRGSLGPRDGRVAIYLRENAPALLGTTATDAPSDADESTEPNPVAALLSEHLERRGASFLFDLQRSVQRAHTEVSDDEFRDALWDLIWSGQITNDTFDPLRSLGRPVRPTRPGRRRTAAPMGGRWWRVDELVVDDLTPTERALAHANALLERYGIVSREVASSESLPGGFGPIYKVLKAMEEAGKIRRGYFVEGLSAAQFARAGAVDRLRSARPDTKLDEPLTPADLVALPAIDPANPYGSLLPWPELANPAAGRPRRSAGSWVILGKGQPLLFVGSRGRVLFTFREASEDSLDAAFVALGQLPRGNRRGRLTVEKIDGEPVRESGFYERLRSCGFESTVRGLAAVKG